MKFDFFFMVPHKSLLLIRSITIISHVLYSYSIKSSSLPESVFSEDTFFLIGSRKPKDKGKGSFKTWLYTIGRNIAIDYLRKGSKNTVISIDENADLIDEVLEDLINIRWGFQKNVFVR